MAPLIDIFYEKILQRLNLKPLTFWKKIRLFCKMFFFVWLFLSLPVIAPLFRLDFLGKFQEENFIVYSCLEIKPQHFIFYLLFLLLIFLSIFFCGKLYGLAKYYLSGLIRKNGEWTIKKN